MKTLRLLPCLLTFMIGAVILPAQTGGAGAADFQTALLALADVDPDTAGPAMRKAAEAGHVEAMFQLAGLHAQGYGVEKSDPEAMRWYGQAAAKGHGEAAKELRTMLDAGLGDPKIHATLRQQLTAATPKPAPLAKSTQAPRPVAPVASVNPPTPAPAPARPAPQLSAATRDATTWDEFFAASARRGVVPHRHHDPDVRLFLEKNPASTGQLRDAYRRARDAFRPTPGTVRGREFGAQFVAYHLAILATGLSEQAAADFVRDDFQALARSDVQSAQQVLMGVAKVPLFRPFLTPQQNQQIRDLANLVIKRQPLPTVPEPSASPAAARPALAATAKTTKPAGNTVDPETFLKGLRDRYHALRATLAKPETNPDSPAVHEQFRELAAGITLATERFKIAAAAQEKQLVATMPGANEFREGNAAFRAKNFAKARLSWEKAANLGNGPAASILAKSYDDDTDYATDRDPAKRFAWTMKAAELGYGPAYGQLIGIFQDKDSPYHDFGKARDWAEKAAQSGDNYGRLSLYLLTYRLVWQEANNPLSGAPKVSDAVKKEVLEQLTTAGLLGHVGAANVLGLHHFHGGIENRRSLVGQSAKDIDYALARFWLQRALAADALTENATKTAREILTKIDATLSLRQGRPLTADEIIAALAAGIPHNGIVYLLKREDAELYNADQYRILLSPGGKTVEEYSLLSMALLEHVGNVGGPGIEAAKDAAIARHKQELARPASVPPTDTPELRARYAAGDPAAAYELYHALSAKYYSNWPESEPPLEDLRAQAITRDYAPAQWMRISQESLIYNNDKTKLDHPRAVALARQSAEAGDAQGAYQLAELYAALGNETGVRRNYQEAEYWYLQSAALAWPDQFKNSRGFSPENGLYSLYGLKRPSGGVMAMDMDPSDDATLRWFRELRRRGGALKDHADLMVAYFSSPRGRGGDVEAALARLPAETSPFTPGELRQLEARAAQNEVPALLALAQAYARGQRGLRQRDDLAVSFYQRAAALGDKSAMTALAEHHQYGYGVKIDLAVALEWKAKSEGKIPAPGESAFAAAEIARQKHDLHHLVEPFLRQSIADGHVPAMNMLGSLLADGRVLKKDLPEAVIWHQRAAEAGDRSSMSSLAYHYDKGEGLPRDLKLSLFWREKAAEKGDRTAMILVGGAYDKGEGTPRDAVKALYWYRQAATAGDTFARNHYVPRLEKELGPAAAAAPATPEAMMKLAAELAATDRPAAVAWVQKAAVANHPPAQYQLGVLHARGEGVARDIARATQLITNAADAGFPPAQLDLGRNLLPGGPDLTADPVRGRAYLEKASAQKEIPQVAAQAADLLRRFAQNQAQQSRQHFATIWANPETRFKELTALYAAADDKGPVVDFFASKIVPAWEQATIPNSYKPVRDLISAHYAIINTMAEPENSQARSLLYFSVHQARLTAEKSGTKYPDFLYNWIRPGGSLLR